MRSAACYFLLYLIVANTHINAIDLTELADRYLSDKGNYYTGHLYTRHYKQLFDDCRETVHNVLEIGLNLFSYSPDITSMKIWVDYFPNAHIYGIDRLPQTFTHERVTTFLADQNDAAFFTALAQQFPQFFDLIIDDGEHNPLLQAKTLLRLFPSLKAGGVYIVEDMHFEEIRAFLRQLQHKQLPLMEGLDESDLLALLQHIESVQLLNSATKGENMFGVIRKSAIAL
jgi:hypothetical protein